MEIRRAESSDIDALVSFNQAMALETENKQLDADVLRAGVTAVFADESKGFYVVASISDTIAAGLMITYEWSDWRNAWFWWVQSVYVLPQHRGQAIYGKMYEFVKQLAEESGNVCGIRLYVEKDNVRAQRVYERTGMQISHYLMYEEHK